MEQPTGGHPSAGQGMLRFRMPSSQKARIEAPHAIILRNGTTTEDAAEGGRQLQQKTVAAAPADHSHAGAVNFT